MESLQGKQRYLREHIPENLYEEFSGYLEEHVGNEDIEKWSYQFVVEIVSAFLDDHRNAQSPLETSFYKYQHANDEPEHPEPTRATELKREPNTKQKQEPAKQKPPNTKPKEDLKVSRAETASVDIPSKSALHLFDSIFDSSNKAAKNQSVKPETSHPSGSRPELDAGKFNAFDSSEFWSSAGVGKGGCSSKLTKSNVDFTSFDFWSQPQPKPQEFKTVIVEPPLSNRTLPSTDRTSIAAIPSFDELISQMKDEIREVKAEKGKAEKAEKVEKQKQKSKKQKQKQKQKEKEKEKEKGEKEKAPSPYQKKSYPEERAATPATNIIKIAYEGETVFKSDFKDSVKCFPSAERQQLKGKDLWVSVESHQVVSRTFLMPDYVMYSLRVHPLNLPIQRNYEDFARLRAVLSDFYPGTKLAYLQGTSWFGGTSAEQVRRQRLMLESFLNDLLRNKELRNSRFVEDFLMLQDHKRIKRKFEEFEKLERPKAIEELCLLQGRVQVTLSEQQRQYQEHLKKYQELMVHFLSRQELLAQQLAEQYRAVAGTLEEMIDLTTGILEETKNFNQRVYGLEVEGVEEVLKVVRGCLAEERKVAGFNLELVTGKLLPFFSYERNNTKELEALIANQQAFLRAYLKRTDTEKTADTSTPYTSDKLAYSKVGVGTESKSLTVLKYQAGFFSNQICHEGRRTFEGLGEKLRELWGRIALRKQEQSLRSLDFWKTLEAPLPAFS